MPPVSSIHIDQALTEISQRVTNTELIADQVWPIVNVRKDSDKYFVYNKANLRAENDEWAPKAMANETDWDVTTESYSTQRRALAQLVEDDEVQNADSPLDIMADTASTLTEKLMIRLEKRLAGVLQTVGNYDADARPDISASASDQWDNFGSADSDPLEDIANGRQIVAKKIFRRPNLVFMSREVFEILKEHPKIIERIKYTQRGLLTPDILASLFDVDRVLIAGGGENTAIEGAADSLAYIWGKHCFLGWVTPSASLRSPSWGYHLMSQRLLAERWRDDPRKGEMLRVSMKETPKVVTQEAGYFLQNVIV